MDELIFDILQQLRDSAQGALDTHQLEMLINSHNSGIDSSAHSTEREKLIPKRAILPYFLQVKQNNDELWQSWNVTPELEERFIRSVRMKPRRTASRFWRGYHYRDYQAAYLLKQLHLLPV